jgi:hypothetical protein
MTMFHTGKFSRPFVRCSAYRQAFERLDENLQQNTQSDSSNAEKIEMLGRHMFGDLWHEPASPHPVEIPK